MQSFIDLHCAVGTSVEVELDESLNVTDAKERIERALLDRQIGRLFPTTKGFMYYPPDERWKEIRIIERLHALLKELFGADHTVSYRVGHDIVVRETDGSAHIMGDSPRV
jgi:hypothetical protein